MITLARRCVEDVVVVDLAGRATLGEGSSAIQDEIRALVDGGHKKILLNMAGISYIDSSGLGEIVSGHKILIDQGGQLKLANLTPRVSMLFEVTRLFITLKIYDTEAAAIEAFRAN